MKEIWLICIVFCEINIYAFDFYLFFLVFLCYFGCVPVSPIFVDRIWSSKGYPLEARNAQKNFQILSGIIKCIIKLSNREKKCLFICTKMFIK